MVLIGLMLPVVIVVIVLWVRAEEAHRRDRELLKHAEKEGWTIR